MRQVRDDELIYELFQATRGLMPSLRKGLALASAERRDQWVTLCGNVLANKLRYYMIFPSGVPAPLNELELADLLIRSIAEWRQTLRGDFASPIDAVRTQARWTAAYILFEVLRDCEVLMDNNEDPPPFRLPGDNGSGVRARDESEFFPTRR